MTNIYFALDEQLEKIIKDTKNTKNVLTDIKVQRDLQFTPFNNLLSKLDELKVCQKQDWFEHDRINTFYYSFGNTAMGASTYLFKDYVIVSSNRVCSAIAIVKPNTKYRHRDKFDTFSFKKIPNLLGFKEVYLAVKNKDWIIRTFDPNFPYEELFEEVQVFIKDEYQKKLYDLTKDIAYSQLTYNFERG